MAKNYVQVGENITVPVENTVKSGDLVLVGSLYGVAFTDAKTDDGTNYYTTIATEGVWEIPGVTGKSVGDPVQVTIGSKNVTIGVATEPSGTSSTNVRLQQGATVA